MFCIFKQATTTTTKSKVSFKINFYNFVLYKVWVFFFLIIIKFKEEEIRKNNNTKNKKLHKINKLSL